MKEPKPMIINTENDIASGNASIWNPLDKQVPTFISEITTPEVDPSQTDVNTLIVGIPSPWARGLMFKYALEYLDEENNPKQTVDPSGLMAFYKSIREEWKGLIACLVLYQSQIRVKKISLAYSDNEDFRETLNIYELGGALGNMLFDQRELWCNPNELQDANPSPYIQLIKFNSTVIGATSPHSLVFTSTRYDQLQGNVPFFVRGKLIDPLKGSLDQQQVQQLYLYVNHVKSKLNDLQSHFNEHLKGEGMSVLKMQGFLQSWIKEMEVYAKQKGFKLRKKGLLGTFQKFQYPFDSVLNTESRIFFHPKDGQFLSEERDSDAREIDPSELLLPDEATTLVEFRFGDNESSIKTCAHYLVAQGAQGPKFFSLPFSDQGMKIFKDKIDNLMTNDRQVKENFPHELTARYDSKANELKVRLLLEIDGVRTLFEKTYQEPKVLDNHKAIIWPDFISDYWEEYYFYSDLPMTGSRNVRLNPLVNNSKGIPEARNPFLPDPLQNKSMKDRQDLPQLIVQYDERELKSGIPYEIYKAKTPFIGMEVRINKGTLNNALAGYLLIKKPESEDPYGIARYGENKFTLTPAKVGVDFGSNNTCISFNVHNGTPQLLKFKNRRRFLLGNELEDKEGKHPAQPHTLLFFQKEEPLGQLMSMLMIHNELRLPQPGDRKNTVTGGFPVFEKNIPVTSSDNSKDTLTLDFKDTQEYIKYNMKWGHDDRSIDHKKAFLKTLWLKINAELFANKNGMYPTELAWAYPAAMGPGIRADYQAIWNELKGQSPINPRDKSLSTKIYNHMVKGNMGSRAMTESEAVCNYALGDLGKMQCDDDRMIIGFDVGGSTADILIIGHDPEAGADMLIKQSSILVAASKLSEAASMSKSIQQATLSFVKTNGLFVQGIDDINEDTAPYFMNKLFNRLQGDELEAFYTAYWEGSPPNVDARETKAMFAIAGFITGLLVFYAGQCVASIISHEGYPHFNEIKYFTLGTFGKGGRIFDWLKAVMHVEAEEFYRDCFLAGLDISDREFEIDFVEKPEHNKSEVSFGLSSYNWVAIPSESVFPEIIGEEGYTLDGEPQEQFDPMVTTLPATEPSAESSGEPILVSNLEKFGSKFKYPAEFKNLNRLVNLYLKYLEPYNMVNGKVVREGLKTLSKTVFKNYVINHPEYKTANTKVNEGQKFEFVHPMIILEGMCLLDRVIMPNCFKTDKNR